MKIVKANAGALTNFEVLDFLNSRGASKDTTRVIAQIARSEYKVYDYLVETAAFTQTRENITKFTEKCKDFKLAKAEILNIINLRPSFPPELAPMIENPDDRGINSDGLEEILKLVQELLPPLPIAEIHKEDDEEEAKNGEQLERPCSFLKLCVSDSKEGKENSGGDGVNLIL